MPLAIILSGWGVGRVWFVGGQVSSGFRCSSISSIVLMKQVYLWRTLLQKIAYVACGCVFEYSVSFIISCVQLVIFSRTYADVPTKSSLPITVPKWHFPSQVILIPVSLKIFCAWSRWFGFLMMIQLFDSLTWYPNFFPSLMIVSHHILRSKIVHLWCYLLGLLGLQLVI